MRAISTRPLRIPKASSAPSVVFDPFFNSASSLVVCSVYAVLRLRLVGTDGDNVSARDTHSHKKKSACAEMLRRFNAACLRSLSAVCFDIWIVVLFCIFSRSFVLFVVVVPVNAAQRSST
jgi:hypothetical protein